MGEDSLGMFDLLTKKQREVQHALEESWNEENDIQLTHSEWFILDLINYGKEHLAEVCRNEEITRQGTHKLVQKLEERGLVKTGWLDNKRNKYVELTPLGINCYEESKALKKEIDDQIKHMLGEKTHDQLKEALGSAWLLEDTVCKNRKEGEYIEGESETVC